MNMENVLQTIGTILITSGGILAITQLWRRTLFKSIIQTNKNIAECIRYNFDLQKKFEADEVNPQSDKFNWEDYEKLAKHVDETFYESEGKKAKSFIKLRFLRFLQKYLIYVSISLMFIGAIIQITGIWI